MAGHVVGLSSSVGVASMVREVAVEEGGVGV